MISAYFGLIFFFPINLDPVNWSDLLYLLIYKLFVDPTQNPTKLSGLKKFNTVGLISYFLPC